MVMRNFVTVKVEPTLRRGVLAGYELGGLLGVAKRWLKLHNRQYSKASSVQDVQDLNAVLKYEAKRKYSKHITDGQCQTIREALERIV
jgi:hypothetical protein